MPNENRVFRQETLQYAALQRKTEELERGPIYHGMIARLYGQVDDPTNAAATIGRGDAWAVVRQLRLRVDANDFLYDLDGPAVLQDAYFFGSGVFPRDNHALIGAGGADPTFDHTVYIPFAPPRWRAAGAYADMALDTRRFSKLEVEVVWGNHLNISSTATGFITAPSLEISGLVAYPEAIDTPPFPGFMRRYQLLHDIPATNDRFQVKLPTGKGYWGFMMNMVDDGVDVDTILNNVRVKSGSLTYADISSEALRELAHQKYGLERSFSGTAFDDVLLGNANDLDGWRYYQHPYDGNVRESIRTVGKAQFELELDVTQVGGVNQVAVYPYEYIPGTPRT